MNRRSLVTAILITLSYQALVVFYYYIDKFTSGIPYLILFALIPVLFITIFVSIIRGFIRIIKNLKNLTLNYCLPTLVYLVVPFLPLPSIEVLESEVVLRGCREATMGSASLQFRQDHSFEIVSTSFGVSNWKTGHWQRRGDTIWLKYDQKEVAPLLGKKVLIDSGYFKRLDNEMNHSKNNAMFHLGYCKTDN